LFTLILYVATTQNVVDSSVNVESHIQQPASKIEVLSELMANTYVVERGAK
jgi:hypothetical protein